MASHKHKKLYVAGAVLLVLILATVWSYASTSRDPVTKFLQKFYPAMFVGSSVITVNDLLGYQRLVDGITTDNGKQQAAQEQLIRVEKMGQVLSRERVVVDSASFAVELQHLKTNADYNKVLPEQFGGSESLLNQYLVRPLVFEAMLAKHYNQDRTLNRSAYAKAERILDQLADGEKFEDLAKAESDDRITGQIGGDLGFIEPGEVIPELEQYLTSSEIGKVSEEVFVSRLGLHVVYPVERIEQNSQTLIHAKHILIATSGFEQWLDSKLRSISFWRIR